MKKCIGCNIDKDTSYFISISNCCKSCNKEKKQLYYLKNKEELDNKAKIYASNNKEKIKERQKIYYLKNKDKIDSQQAEYQKNNPEKIKNYKKRYDQKNKKKINDYYNFRYNNDSLFKLRRLISSRIRRGLKISKSSKFGKSINKYTPFTFNELKVHIASHFIGWDSWMNWSNWGAYNSKIWDDNDCLTWTWQLDHIIPHSEFKYASMEDQSFKDCWSLDNLRPLDSKQNLYDGILRIRHNI